MAQHDYVISNGTGAAVRSDLNNALLAIVSQNSGATEPTTTYAYQWWADTTTGLLKIRNAANNAWITLRELDGTLTIEDGTASSPGLAFADDLNTGIYSPSADQLGITTGGTVRLTTTTTGITSALPVDVPLGTASAPTVTFTGDLNTGIYSPGADQVAISTSGAGRVFVDASGNVGVGTATPNAGITVRRNAVGNLINTDDGTIATYIADTTGSLLNYGTFTSHAVAFKTANTERARIDSSGRLLVGTSSTSASALLTVQGSSSAAAGAANINIQRGTAATSIVADNVIGQINFGDSSANAFANISCSADAAAGTNDYPGRLSFSTTADGASSPTEHARINQQGALKVTSNGSYQNATNAVPEFYSNRNGDGLLLYNTFGSTFGGSFVATSYNWATSTGGYLFYSDSSTQHVYDVRTDGNVRNLNNSYTGTSDIKLKENIVDASSQWDDLKALQVRKYNFKVGPSHTQIGLIAQEVEPICPGLVVEYRDRDIEGNDLGTVTKSVNYSVLYMKAVKALQEAMERIEQLEAEMAEVKAQLS